MVKGIKLDKFGDAYTTQCLPGDGWRLRHDALKWALSDICRRARWLTEVEPTGLFAKFVPAPAHAQDPEAVHNSLQNILPDLLVLESTSANAWIADVKCVYISKSESNRYISAQSHEPRYAVNKRATDVQQEYVRKARKADRDHNDTEDDAKGPIETALDSYPRVRGLAFGAFSEASDSVDRLVTCAAEAEAENEWSSLPGACKLTAFSVFVARSRRRLGIIAARTHARLLVNGRRNAAARVSQARLTRQQARRRLDDQAEEHFSLFGPRAYAPFPRDQEWGLAPG